MCTYLQFYPYPIGRRNNIPIDDDYGTRKFPEIGELHEKKLNEKANLKEHSKEYVVREYKWKSCVIDMCTKAIIIVHMI